MEKEEGFWLILLMHTSTFIKEVNHIEMSKELMLNTIFASLSEWSLFQKVIIEWLDQIVHYLLRSFTFVCFNSYYFLTEWSNFAVNSFDRFSILSLTRFVSVSYLLYINMQYSSIPIISASPESFELETRSIAIPHFPGIAIPLQFESILSDSNFVSSSNSTQELTAHPEDDVDIASITVNDTK